MPVPRVGRRLTHVPAHTTPAGAARAGDTTSTDPMSEISEISGSRRVTGKGFIIYEVSVSHPELGLKEILRHQFPAKLEHRAEALAARWDRKWQKHLRRQTRGDVLQESRNESVRPAESGRLHLGTSN